MPLLNTTTTTTMLLDPDTTTHTNTVSECAASTNADESKTTSTGTSTTTSSKRRVSFKPTTTIVTFQYAVETDDDGEENTTATSSSSWITMAERTQFVADARSQSKAWIAKGCASLLQGVFHDTSEVAQEKITACTQLPGDGYCRGLERYVCREHGLTRESFQKGTLRTIVGEWKKCKAAGLLSDAESWDSLGEVSRRLTSFATRFARRIGVADELVAQQGTDPSKARKLLLVEFNAAKALQLQRQQQRALLTSRPACPSSPDSISSTVDTSAEKTTSLSPLPSPPPPAIPTKTRLVTRLLSERSVVAVNSWCHGPRESYSVAQVSRIGRLPNECE